MGTPSLARTSARACSRGRSLYGRRGGDSFWVQTDSINGKLVRRSAEGTYEVNADCSGTSRFTGNFGQTTHLDFVLVRERTEIHFIETDPDTVTTRIARKQ